MSRARRLVGGFLDLDEPYRRLLLSLVLLIALVAAGTGGYMVIEGWGLVDALFMTVVTLSTVGYREVHPLSRLGQLFTMLLIVGGVGGVLYTLTGVVGFAVEGELGRLWGGRRMLGRIRELEDHYIICGFGRVGQEVAADLANRGAPFVIIEQSRELATLARRRHLVIEGDATDDELLRQARVEQARCLIAAVGSDADNTYITLSAKAINPRVFVVARIDHAGAERKLRQAGADRVISPYSIGGRHMALAALQPLFVDFIEVMDTLIGGRRGNLMLAELLVTADSALAGKPVEEALAGSHNVTVLAIRAASGQLLLGPARTTVVNPGDQMIAIGDERELERLNDGRPVHMPPVD